eukprot:SAG22_NODE_18495_length_286_cov_0.914439_1_plen_55_part_10
MQPIAGCGEFEDYSGSSRWPDNNPILNILTLERMGAAAGELSHNISVGNFTGADE